jgi:phospholipase C
MTEIDRRTFLRTTGAVGAAAAIGGAGLLGCDDSSSQSGSILHSTAKESPIDTIVVLMMENRSFDHYYGWLGTNESYLEAGRRRFGKDFHVDARLDLAYPDPGGRGAVNVRQLTKDPNESNPWRGCNHPVPGHGWFAGRRQLAAGFLADGTGNDEFAIGYYQNEDLPVHARLAERFTVLDHSHASLLCGTMPNRQYLHSGTSQGQKEDPGPFHVGMWKTDTIWNLLDKAGVDAAYYYTDIPMLLLWGKDMRKFIRPADRFFEDCANGTLPRVVMIDPGFIEPLRTDDHPLSDVRIGQRFIREVFGAFVGSKHWERGAFILTYDEWGGFFDHVPPPLLADDLASPINDDSFAQSGFRVPTVLASPYSSHGGVDHRVYDHTSILRFIQWRFLGAPPEGPGKAVNDWALSKRNQYANNIGASLSTEHRDLELHYDADVRVGGISDPCPGTVEAELLPLLEHSDPFVVGDDFRDEVTARYPGPTLTPWIEGEALKILPNQP